MTVAGKWSDMSKIKDLYAIENEIDDLMPVRKPSVETIVGAAVKQATAYSQDVYDELFENAQFTQGRDDEGHIELYFENYIELCNDIADKAIDHIMEDWQLDLTHDEYRVVLQKVADIIADTYADYESDIIRQAKEDQLETQAQRETYNNQTLPKQ